MYKKEFGFPCVRAWGGDLVVELPRDAVQAADSKGCQLLERRRGEVEVIFAATHTAVDDGHGHRLAVVYDVLSASARSP